MMTKTTPKTTTTDNRLIMIKKKLAGTFRSGELKSHLTRYSFLNPAFSLADMFVICALIFLMDMFLLVGGPLFVLSGRAYVDSMVLIASLFFDLQSNIEFENEIIFLTFKCLVKRGSIVYFLTWKVQMLVWLQWLA